MKYVVLFALLIMNTSLHAQIRKYRISRDPKKHGLIFNGPLSFRDLDREKSFTWMKTEQEGYHADAASAAYLAQHLADYSIVVFLGTWCSDSHDLVPKFERLLQEVHYPDSTVKLYGVDREKTTKGGEHKVYEIEFVPTFILIRNGKEAGRITETVDKSLEEDLAGIIRKDRDEGAGGH